MFEVGLHRISQVAELVDVLTPCDNFRNEKRFTGSNPVLTTTKHTNSWKTTTQS